MRKEKVNSQINTLLQVAQSNAETKTCKRVFFSPAQEEFYFFSPTLRCFNFFATAQPTTDKQSDSLFQTLTGQCNLTRTIEARTANMGLASCGVKYLNSSSVFQINFSAGLTVLCSEIPHERQAQKRWLQC